MGKGNVQKAAAKREKNQKKLESEKKAGRLLKNKNHFKFFIGSVKESVVKNMTIQCTFCKQSFLGGVGKVKLEEHAATHEKSKKTFADCFPGFVE